jgi:hypothetical protein
MKYRIINRPIFVERKHYLEKIRIIIAFLSKQESVKSIYQLGSIADPGISDVDMLVVFKKNKGFTDDPRKILDQTGKYLFTHQLFGIHEDHIEDAMKYSMFNNFDYLYGDKIATLSMSKNVVIEVNIQIAIEYLLKMYISLSVQQKCGIIKLRSFLLEAKAVRFDLAVLGLSESNLSNIVDKIISLRKHWFEDTNTDSSIIKLFLKFHYELGNLLQDIAKNNFLFVNKMKQYTLSKNIRLINGDFSFSSKSKLPASSNFVPNKYLNKYFGIKKRFSKFDCYFPMKIINDKVNLLKKNHYETHTISMLNSSAPKFIPLKSPIRLNE